MFNRTFYTLQAKKALWFTSMLAMTAFALINSALTPFTMLGLSLGIGAFHTIYLMPRNFAYAALTYFPLIALFTPFALPFSFGFVGTRAMNNSKPSEVINTHKLSEAEHEDLKIFNKLSKKTGISIKEINVRETDSKISSPQASAAGGIANHTINVSKNLITLLTPKERKAVYAHEYGHLKNWDFLSHILTRFLWQLTFSVSVASFSTLSLGGAIALCSVASMSYYAISQIDELLADCYSAQHSNPKELISALEKITSYKIESKISLVDIAQLLIEGPKYLMGMTTHPSLEIRKSYLTSYAEEKEAAKEKNLRATAGLRT